MKPLTPKMKCALALLIGGILAAGPAMAEKPSWAGGKNEKNEHKERQEKQKGERHDGGGKSRNGGHDTKSRGDGHSSAKGGHFEERHREVVRGYYTEEFSHGRCPPGLAKKHNGCMPPGQAKKWQRGKPLPREVIFYDLPPQVVVQIGVPPQGYRYVRVATDILLIAIGTGMVIDAIDDLGR
ncbi:MAG: RcnB family protein [Burkholderiales bacterium]|nr:RcnB family protein [Burkholderiales bacterium]